MLQTISIKGSSGQSPAVKTQSLVWPGSKQDKVRKQHG